MKSIKKTRSTLFFLFSTFILLLACLSTLLWQNQQQHDTHAADLSFVVAPTLPAATVDTILTNMGSPMAGVGSVIEQASQNYQIDDAFALAVWNVETSEGIAGVGRSYLNPGGVRASPAYPAGFGGYTLYPSYAEGVQDWFRIVHDRYVSRGLYSVYTLCVPYVGTSHSYEWAAKVSNLMLSFRDQAPQATPAPTPTPLVFDKQLASADARMLQVSKTVTAPSLQANATSIASQLKNVPNVNLQIASATSTHQPLAFALILLAALGIALGALFIGKKELALPIREPEKRYEPVTPLPLGNAYSPLFEIDTAPQLPISIPANLPKYIQPLALPSLASSAISIQSLNNISQPQPGGLLKRYVTTESLKEAQEKQSVPRITEDLAYRQMVEVSQKKAVPRITEDLVHRQMLEASQEKKGSSPIIEDLAYRQMLEVSERAPVGAGTYPSAFRRPRRLVPISLDAN